MLLSIIVPAYNAETTLERCVASIVDSSVFRAGDAELIIVDDGSTDGTSAICQALAMRERVSVIGTRNGGVGAARNRGLDSTSGQFITFLDSDDWVASDFHARLLRPLVEDHALALSVAGFTTVKPEGHVVTSAAPETVSGAHVGGRLVDLMLQGLLNPVWNKVYRAELIEQHQVRFEVGRKNAEDLFFNLAYLRALGAIAIVQTAGLYWVRDSTSATHVLASRYEAMHELDASIAYRESLTRCLAALGAPSSDIERYFHDKDGTWFYVMVTNIQGDGTPYGLRGQVRQIRRVMDFEPARANILLGGSGSRVARANRWIYRVDSAVVAWCVYRVL